VRGQRDRVEAGTICKQKKKANESAWQQHAFIVIILPTLLLSFVLINSRLACE